MKKKTGDTARSYGRRVKRPRGEYKLTAQLIRSARRKQRLSQTRLAQYFGYHGQYVANWEAGVSTPPVTALKKLAKILKIPLKQIIELRLIEYKEKLFAEL